uniref:Uncharacterized protein n=1 Tax=Candidatus Kentrum sp. FW TaxID=2126338 RepID=A0A450SFF0_9GAMM|nr:MAG: hypothetical protein BECKFW1821A_GA0114235_10321 [Candidatus Kentron sp. FW]
MLGFALTGSPQPTLLFTLHGIRGRIQGWGERSEPQQFPLLGFALAGSPQPTLLFTLHGIRGRVGWGEHSEPQQFPVLGFALTGSPQPCMIKSQSYSVISAREKES